MVNGCFRYTLDDLQTKLLPGRFKLILQLNERRFADRRKPQQMTSVAQPFDESKFNFTKVHDKEVSSLFTTVSKYIKWSSDFSSEI